MSPPFLDRCKLSEKVDSANCKLDLASLQKCFDHHVSLFFKVCLNIFAGLQCRSVLFEPSLKVENADVSIAHVLLKMVDRKTGNTNICAILCLFSCVSCLEINRMCADQACKGLSLSLCFRYRTDSCRKNSSWDGMDNLLFLDPCFDDFFFFFKSGSGSGSTCCSQKQNLEGETENKVK